MDYLKCNISYDYEEMMEELQNLLQDGELNLEDEIQVFRAKEAIASNYYPIEAWLFQHDLQVEFIREDEDTCNTKQQQDIEHQRVQNVLADYESIRPLLTSIKVKDVLAEMEYMDRIIK